MDMIFNTYTNGDYVKISNNTGVASTQNMQSHLSILNTNIIDIL